MAEKQTTNPLLGTRIREYTFTRNLVGSGMMRSHRTITVYSKCITEEYTTTGRPFASAHAQLEKQKGCDRDDGEDANILYYKPKDIFDPNSKLYKTVKWMDDHKKEKQYNWVEMMQRDVMKNCESKL